MTEKALLENILTAEVLTLSRILHIEKKEKGVNKIGGDYTREAIEEIKRSRADVIARLIAD